MSETKNTKQNDEQIEKDAKADEIDNAIGKEVRPTIWDRLHEANKAIIAAVAAIATLAISIGFGDADLWTGIAAVVAALLGVVGVFAVANDPAPEDEE